VSFAQTIALENCPETVVTVVHTVDITLVGENHLDE
jgi:hypothetical protein